ncbi:MAG: MBL fold metallo-hydrolase [Bacteroidota bacterium]
MIEVKSFVFNPFMENTYVLYDETKECIIIDPGCYEDHEKQELSSFIASKELKVSKLINTHCHIDHVFGNHYVKQTYDVELFIHQSDEATLKSVEVYAPNYGFMDYEPTEAEHFLDEGDQVSFGNSTLDMFFVPGHAPGHLAFYNKDQKICIGGDVLFQRSIGRTDLPGGDHDTLIESIHNKMFSLDDDFVVYTGHGPTTTIGEEKRHNPFCAIAN